MLLYILQEFSKETGHPISSAASRNSALEKINKAARELYDTTDLPGCLREQVFTFDPTNKMVTLPSYVGQIRGVRRYESTERIKLEDLRPRYHSDKSFQSIFEWRIKQIVPVLRTPENSAPYKITATSANGEAFKVYISGVTDVAQSDIDVFEFDVSDVEKIGTKVFLTSPLAITKDKLTTVNLSVFDASDNLIAEIPNNERQSRYTLVQVLDDKNDFNASSGDCNCYEILYKLQLTTLKNDYDVFPCDGYDDAIVWKAVSHFWQKVMSDLGKANALAAETRLNTILAQKANDSESGIEKEIQFAPNRLFSGIRTHSYPTGRFNKNY